MKMSFDLVDIVNVCSLHMYNFVYCFYDRLKKITDKNSCFPLKKNNVDAVLISYIDIQRQRETLFFNTRLSPVLLPSNLCI